MSSRWCGASAERPGSHERLSVVERQGPLRERLADSWKRLRVCVDGRLPFPGGGECDVVAFKNA